MPPTMQDIADELGVSRVHVSRAIFDRGPVRAELKEKILATAERLGYRPHQSARALASGKTMTIGIFSHLQTGFFNAFLPSIAVRNELLRAFAERGYTLKLVGLNETATDAMDGIVCPNLEGLESYMKLPAQDRLPVVSFFSYAESEVQRAAELGIPALAVDRKPAMRAMAREAKRHGIRRVGIIAYEPGDPARVDESFDSICQALTVEGLPIAPADRVFIAREPQTITAQILQALPRMRDWDLAIIRSEHLAVHVYQAAAIAELRVPDELALFGYDPPLMTGQMRPALGGIQWDMQTMCTLAAQTLIDCLEGRECPPVRLIDCQVERGETLPW